MGGSGLRPSAGRPGGNISFSREEVMGLEIVVTTQDNDQGVIPPPDARKKYEVLADRGEHEAVSVRIQELVDRIFTEVREAVKVACTVEVQVSGKVTLTGKADAKFLVFNIGGGAATETTMTIKMSATLSPLDQPAARRKG
jgi:hypothetical protein